MLTHYSPPLFAHSEDAAEAHAGQHERAILDWIEAEQIAEAPEVPATFGALVLDLLGAALEWAMTPRRRGR